MLLKPLVDAPGKNCARRNATMTIYRFSKIFWQDHGASTQASYEKSRERGYAYVDKTPFIKVLEECGTLYSVIVRPRRFGKSVFVNMLMAYYQKSRKTESL